MNKVNKPRENTTKRIPLTPDAFELIRGFARGSDLEYSEVIRLLVGQVVQPGESPLAAGERFREEQKKAQN